ncbi:histidine kinase [Geobacter grbiciae]|uniref:histidine kinase n=1 Tax=Geobacter grbiciae TaxID=155042 RepID=UPI001C037C14|nr:histidine kinase [Geobacter grbiciae]MBT1074298.1 histidine kinase [Geobacter grbiciae]
MKKKVLAVSAACALTAATAVPALALENEFHGMFRVKGTISNFDDSGTGRATVANGVLSDNAKTKNFVDQRARIMYIAKANDDLKLVTHFEVDSQWGDNSYAVGRNDGGSIGADQVNIETKNIYLDFNIPAVPVNMKVGIQPFTDAYKGIYVNTDMAGALATARYGNFTNALGWFRLDDRKDTVNTAGVHSPAFSSGKDTRDIIVLDSKYALNKDVKLGGSYYLYNDDKSAYATDSTKSFNDIIHTVGLNAEANLGAVIVDGFALYQFGNLNDTRHLSAWAANVGARGKLGIGTLRAQFLYTSGDTRTNGTSNSFVPVINHTSGADAENTFYPADMRLILRDKWGTTDDRAIVYNSDNGGEGLFGGFVGYDANLTSKVFANANAGFVAAAKTNKANNYMGTEVNAEIGYKLYDNMTASIQGAYVFLGDYYDNSLDDPYLSRIVLNYAF